MTIQNKDKKMGFRRLKFLREFQELLNKYDASIYALNDGTKDFPVFKFEVAINAVFENGKEICPFDNFKLEHIDKDSYE